MPQIKLKKGRDRSIQKKHPWIFSGAIDSISSISSNGETVKIISADGKLLGYGSYSLKSQIAVRLLTDNDEEIIDKKFFYDRINSAVLKRQSLINRDLTNAYRLINAESDFLPGLIVDKYSNFIVCQFLSAGMEYWKMDIVNILVELLNPLGIYERSDSDIREKEGLEKCFGNLFGQEPSDLIEVYENGYRFLVDIIKGHKTGFYLDQRENRELLENYCEGKEVLNCFSYSGGFSVYALKSNALKVTNVDSSDVALNLAQRNLVLNRIDEKLYENINEDVFKYLRKMRDSQKEFDIVILDPPKFAESSSQIEKASRGYKDINLLAMKLLKQNGLLFTFSCSGHISNELFSRIIADAALDSGKSVQIVKYLIQSLDHPIITNFPESLYLKGLLCQIN